MRISDLEAPCREALCVLCEELRAIGDSVISYRLYATLAKQERSRFFVSVTGEGEQDGTLVPREGLEEAASLYRILLRAGVTPCHFLDIVEDLDREMYGAY